MKKILKYHIYIFSLFLLTTCGKHNLLDQPNTHLKFSELPLPVQIEMLKVIEPEILTSKNGEKIKVYGDSEGLVCIDKTTSCDYNIDWDGSFINKHIFKIEGQTITMTHNGNEVNAPYVYYKNELYYRKTLNTLTKEEVLNGEYGKYNLHNIIKN